MVSAGESGVGVDALTSARQTSGPRARLRSVRHRAAPRRFPSSSFLREWLDRGYAGDDGLDRSAPPIAAPTCARVVPGARSVIVTGTLYNTDRPYSTETRPTRRRRASARYAWGDDYHDVLKARLDALLAWMRARLARAVRRACLRGHRSGAGARVRAVRRARLDRQEHLPDQPRARVVAVPRRDHLHAALDPDTQGLEQCGICTRCLEACPTGALVEPGVLDSTRCLSYLTIELRGGIPEEHRPAIGTTCTGATSARRSARTTRSRLAPATRRGSRAPALDLPRLVDLWRRPDARAAAGAEGERDDAREARRACAATSPWPSATAATLRPSPPWRKRARSDPPPPTRWSSTTYDGRSPALLNGLQSTRAVDLSSDACPTLRRSCCSRCRRWPTRTSRAPSCCCAITRSRARSASSSTGRWTSRRGRWSRRSRRCASIPICELWVGGPVDPQQTWVLMAEAQGPDDEQREICAGRAPVGVARADAAAAAGAAFHTRARHRRLLRLGAGSARQGDCRLRRGCRSKSIPS